MQREELMQLIGANFRTLRINKKKNKEVVAITMNISIVMLDKIENGEYELKLDLFFDLCAYYKISPVDILSKI